MCRWLAYSGARVPLERLIFETQNSLIDQSLESSDSAATTNGDGFGIGWYDGTERPGLYKHTQPAWNDSNLRDLCAHVWSRLFLAHVRSATGASAIQQSNCHPFRFGRWLFMHNGSIRGFDRLRRDLMMAVDETYFNDIQGTTDTEIMFYLSLTFGLEKDPHDAVERMAGFVEETGKRKGVEFPLQMTLGIADGHRIFAVRYSSEHKSKSLFHSRSMAALRELAPPELRESIDQFSEDARAVVSEPLTEMSEPWKPVHESTFLTVEKGDVHHAPFKPRRP